MSSTSDQNQEEKDGIITDNTCKDGSIENDAYETAKSSAVWHSSHPCCQPEILAHIVSFACSKETGSNNRSSLSELLACRLVSRSWSDAVRQMAVPAEIPLTVQRRHVALRGLPIVASVVVPHLQYLVYDLMTEEEEEAGREETFGRTMIRTPRSGLTDDLLSALVVVTDDDDDDDKDGKDGPSPQSRLCFPRLRHLVIAQSPSLTGRAFSDVLCRFRHLQTLNVRGNEELSYTLADVAASFPNLRVLRATNNRKLTGRLSDLMTKNSSIAQTLQVLELSGCPGISGQLSDLRTALPALRELGLDRTQVSGDLRTDIQRKGIDFAKLQILALDPNNNIYGARSLQAVADAPAVMRARHIIASQSRAPCPVYPFLVKLDESSPDFYYGRPQQRLYQSERDPPTQVVGFFVGPSDDPRYRRWGWRWTNLLGGECDVHWLDDAPLPPSAEEDSLAVGAYETYLEEYKDAMSNNSCLFHGCKQLPTPDEYRELNR